MNGASLFKAATLDTRELNLSWSKPATGTPYGYTVEFLGLPLGIPNASYTLLLDPVLTLHTAKTSLTIPPELLTAGRTYLIDIRAQADAKANMEASPYRSALPVASANVVSAFITISPSAP